MAPSAKPPPANQVPLDQINRILACFDEGLNNVATANRVGISRRCIDKIRLNVSLFGKPYPTFAKRGRPRLLLEWQELQVLDYLRDRPTSYHDETAWFVYDEFGVVVSERWVSDLIKRRRFSKKKAQRVAAEANQELRNDWRNRQTTIPAHRVCWVDESASNERTGWRKYGYSPVGVPCKDTGSAKRSKRWSILPAMTQDGWLPNPLVY